MGRSYPIIIGVLVLGLAVWVVGEAFSGEGGLHDYDVTSLNQDWKVRLNQDVRIAGIVVDQSLRGDMERLDVVFDVEDEKGSTIAVGYKKLLPDPFDYGREVIVEGTVVGKGKIEARNITVKCPSRYQDGAVQEEVPDRYQSSPLSLRYNQNVGGEPAPKAGQAPDNYGESKKSPYEIKIDALPSEYLNDKAPALPEGDETSAADKAVE
jgi:cytochrome c-type biogenesis protein CcmE